MSKFVVKKRFQLDFLNEDWKEAYIEFSAFTVKDIKERLSKLAQLDQKDTNEIAGGLDQMIELLKEKFVSGKGVDITGKLIDLEKEDIGELPVEAISKAVSFLSQGLNPKG